MIFKNQVHQDIWIEHNCATCHAYARTDTVEHMRKPQCPILTRALKSGRKPPEWERNIRKNTLMAETIKCTAYSKQPPIIRAPKDFDDVAMFDVQPVGRPEDTDHA